MIYWNCWYRGQKSRNELFTTWFHEFPIPNSKLTHFFLLKISLVLTCFRCFPHMHREFQHLRVEWSQQSYSIHLRCKLLQCWVPWFLGECRRPLHVPVPDGLKKYMRKGHRLYLEINLCFKIQKIGTSNHWKALIFV